MTSSECGARRARRILRTTFEMRHDQSGGAIFGEHTDEDAHGLMLPLTTVKFTGGMDF